jgi:uncharacterized membrane protein YfcA
VALLPAAVASLYGYRDEVRANRGWLKTLFLPSLVGGTVGSVLLLRTPEAVFATLAPLLILFATALFMIQGYLSRRSTLTVTDPSELSRGRWLLASFLQLGVALYGGYFGAGIGILMLALLGFLGLANIHAAYFIYKGAVVWPAALVIVLGATLGGYAGARFAKRIGKEKARAAVVVIGLLVTAILIWQQATK